MNTNVKQAETLGNLLEEKNYNIRQAARAINKSSTQVYYVVRGKRSSSVIVAALLKLPKRTLNLRERITTSKKGARA